MLMSTEVVVFSCNHYEMSDNKGVSVRILGSNEETNNKFGVSVSEAKIPNFHELDYLKRFKGQFPAKFKANIQMATIKSNNNKEVISLSLSELEFIESLELVSKKVSAISK